MLTALVFKIAQLLSARVLFAGVLWFLGSYSLLIPIAGLILLLDYPDVAGKLPDWLKIMVFAVLSLAGLVLAHWPFLTSLRRRIRRKFSRVAAVSLILWTLLIAFLALLFGAMPLKEVSPTEATTEQLQLFSVIYAVMALVLVELACWLSAKLATYPEA
jgi:uncharacterized membrane protein (UPF0182 family)